ncbi:MAG: Peptidyl-prolyl cis-trans isomerase [Microgenomates group bacterium GW2011_GWC1_41_20]|uniref:Peptidyl-prolyl cis-trans isomerase n=7 Tax=Candidatus Woeseibacteriota TaxID=1752722 RepID=A0A0G0U8T5_9BACT|nr:MAG: Peptidyl-prolyl cis-trans isomerase [Candidatus Woesebacteria bacterium GW2011_GWB1_40_12]KKR55895.1 MAG: Peptidyl-prolyl cis-trans isomerase [Candidatus Woesebacteria bacterium GW2011_GWF1_40_24]KKR90876.1 MAG: Peptidyl-prolyl cis-trans isomerase [Candidatus Woesebacteria bacterium GW2011_GWD1_41_12]KKS00500.1 MAG: Peptidyl-prolyl cis-trans isomerase [Microgenomates group bacterium GW2011_GWC1_41_20]KKS05632.1 MAG: Peptidyl-prolyl cis-trans isomerase [Candidatus Woesebacteria bacterium
MDDQNLAGQSPDKKYLFVTIFLALLIVVGIFLIVSKKDEVGQVLQTSTPSDTITSAIESSQTVKTPSSKISIMNATELQIEDIKVGTGDIAVPGKTVTVNYVGTLTDGTKFDSSYDRNQAFSFALGAGEVIPGWDQGVAGMKVGGKRKLVIPSDLAYGDSGIPGAIPGGATLIFEVELLKVE